MSVRLIVKYTNDQLRVMLRLEPDLEPEEAPPFDFISPLTPEEREDLRWYLEDYLAAPYAVWEERGSNIAATIDDWGERLFESVFPGGTKAHEKYLKATALGYAQLDIVSDSAAFLGLPWEILRDPDRKTLPAFAGAGIKRTIDAEGIPAKPREIDKLRILMIIARPGGTKDVGHQMVARPLLERLQAVGDHVELEVVRPPTFDELKARLARAKNEGRPIDVVHFDGHGTFGVTADTDRTTLDATRFRDGTAEGVLIFEDEAGEKKAIKASVFANAMKNEDEEVKDVGVPLLVFNACRSASLTDDVAPEAAVATRLLDVGAAAVVAMGYSVYAEAAAEFMAVFYAHLATGETVARAVTEGRRHLRENPERPSPKGRLPLADWMVPVHYARRDVRFAVPKAAATSAAVEAVVAPPTDGVHGEGELTPAAGYFVGRDTQFLELERALRLEKVVLTHGIGGSGKTELAKAFARWWSASGGLTHPDLVFFHSFEPGQPNFGLDGVLKSIGFRVRGVDFVREYPTFEERRDGILRLMTEHRMLLVWDNFETVHEMPDALGITKPLEATERDGIVQFLNKVRSRSSSAVIITSRSSEPWLGPIHRLPEVEGLRKQEAAKLADRILAASPGSTGKRDDEAFGALMERLGGHPLSMRLVLPGLGMPRATAASVLEDLRTGDAGAGDEANGDRHGSLSACIDYSLRCLSDADQDRLVVLSLFEDIVDSGVAALLSMRAEVPSRLQEIAGEDWQITLENAANVGLLSRVGPRYRLHPTLPRHMATRWKAKSGSGYDQERERCLVASLHAWSMASMLARQQIEGGNDSAGVSIIAMHRANLGRALAASLERELYDVAQSIVNGLREWWSRLGATVEEDGWIDRILTNTEGTVGEPPEFGSPRFDLWALVIGFRGDRQIDTRQLGDARDTYDSMRIRFEAAGDNAKPQLAATYHQLGIVAQERGKLDDAENWYTKSLEIETDLNNRPGLAATYHHLGSVAEERGKLDDAENWYTKSLEINTDLNNRPDMAATYHQLGIVAQERGKLDDAENWYTKSLEIDTDLNNRPGMATTYHQLGVVAQKRGELDDAENWYTKSLEIKADLDNRPGMATTYHQLGNVAQERGHPTQAMSYSVRSVAIDIGLETSDRMTALRVLVHRVAEQGIEAFDAAWLEAVGSSAPEALRSALLKAADDAAS